MSSSRDQATRVVEDPDIRVGTAVVYIFKHNTLPIPIYVYRVKQLRAPCSLYPIPAYRWCPPDVVELVLIRANECREIGTFNRIEAEGKRSFLKVVRRECHRYGTTGTLLWGQSTTRSAYSPVSTPELLLQKRISPTYLHGTTTDTTSRRAKTIVTTEYIHRKAQLHDCISWFSFLNSYSYPTNTTLPSKYIQILT